MERVGGSLTLPGIGRRAVLWAALGTAAMPPCLYADTGVRWDGPTEGPRGSGPRNVAVLAEDLRNGGVLGVAQGLREAARVLGWALQVYDAAGSQQGRRQALEHAFARSPDGVAVCGMDAAVFEDECRRLSLRPRYAVGWHVGHRPGPMTASMIATNISTDPDTVGQVAARAAAPEGEGRSGIVLFTDSRFRIATAKAQAMARTLKTLPGAALLETLDVPISGSAEQVPGIVSRLVQEHARRWTHALAINDIYFDHAVPTLIALGERARHLRLISAGDGSASAFVRIRSGTYQTATVAEPLNMQGWQMADELNRLFMQRPVSGFITPVTLVTRDQLARAAGATLGLDPQNGYRDAYRRIWSGER
jgi:ribose transport system substrate-binding protein